MHNHYRITGIVVALMTLLFATAISITAQVPDPVWTGQYYDNSERNAPVAFTRVDNEISFDWGFGSPPGLTDNEFSVTWSTDAYFTGGTYRFWALSDDQIRITIDYNNVVINTFDTNAVDVLVSNDVTLSEGVHHIEVVYRELIAQAFVYVDFANLASNPSGPDFGMPSNQPPTGAWTASYYSNPNLAGTPILTRGEMQPGGNWGYNSPLPAVPADNWSARWTSTLNLEGGNYRITARADDGVRVYIDDTLVIDEWHIARAEEYVATRNLFSGSHTVTVEYYESAGLAFLDFTLEQIDEPTPGSFATVTAGLLNVRDAPNPLTGNILTRISNGETVPVIAKTADDSWVQVNANGVIGWVNANYVYVPDLPALPIVGGDQQPQGTGYTVTATPYPVNIRTGPGTQYDDIGNLPEGATATVIGRNPSANWWQINYNGIVGWVSAEYALIEAGANLANIPIQSPS